MSTVKRLPTDPDLLGSIQAIKRAAQRALKIAEATNTPCYVMQDGKVVDIARKPDSKTDEEGAKPKRIRHRQIGR